MPNKVEDQALWARMVRPLAVVLGLCTSVAGGLAAWQWAMPLTAPTLFPLSETWYAKSVASASAAEGIADAQKAIKLAPARAENWMLLAYQYNRADQKVSSRVVSAVRQSYAVGPLTIEVSAYRLGFVFNTWPGLPDDVRNLAREEARQYGTTGLGLLYLQQTVPTIADPRAHLEFAVITLVDQTKYAGENQRLQRIHEGKMNSN